MDWTSWIGRTRPVELDSLRLLVLLHRLGREPADAYDGAEPDAERGGGPEVVLELRGERRAQHLDHLLAHPATLAYVLMDAYLQAGDSLADQRGAMARRARWLLAHDRRRYDPERRSRSRRGGQSPSARVDPERLHRFRPFAWRRWDNALATLHSRGLLRVRVGHRPGSGGGPLCYGLTSQAVGWLEKDVYQNHAAAGFHVKVCTVIADFLPDVLSEEDAASDRLVQTGERLANFRRDQNLTAADDLAPPRFYSAFRESL